MISSKITAYFQTLSSAFLKKPIILFPGWADEKRAKPQHILVKCLNSKDKVKYSYSSQSKRPS